MGNFLKVKWITWLVLIIGPLAYAEGPKQDELRNYFGFQSGWVHSSALLTTNESYTSGFEIGVQADVPFASWFSIQPALRFMEKGFSYQNEQGNTQSVGLDYLELPVLAKFKLPTGTIFSPYVYLGPYIAFRTGDSGTVTSDSTNTEYYPTNLGTTFSNGDIERFDSGLELGIGIEAQISADTRTFVAIERTISLTNFLKDPSDPFNDGGPVTLDILGGVSFAF
jgi:hypothetical protein